MHRKQAIILASGILLALLAAVPSFAQQKRAIVVGEAKGLPFSDGIVAGNTLYIAGTEGTDENNKLRPGGIGPETQAALDNIQKVLKQAAFELQDIVSVKVYFADIKDFSEMTKV